MGSTYHPSSVWTHSRSPELDPEFRHIEMPLTKNNTGELNVDTITMDGRKSNFDKHTFKIYKLNLYYFNSI